MYEKPEEHERIFGNDYDKNREKFLGLLIKIEDPVVKEALDTLHHMCMSFSIYHVAKQAREELGLDIPKGREGFEKGATCVRVPFLELVTTD